MPTFREDDPYSGKGFDPVEAGMKLKVILAGCNVGDTWSEKRTRYLKKKFPEDKKPPDQEK